MNKLQKIIGIGSIALATIGLAGCKPSIREIKDLTGDGIPDAIVDIRAGFNTYLFIGNGDGTYTRATEHIESGISFFKTEKGEAYFLNEQGFYQKAGSK